MNIEDVSEYCLSLAHATEDMPFDESTVAFRVGGKIFAMLGLERTDWFVLKCNPEYATELRERHKEIKPAWHMNKRHWNQIDIYGFLSDQTVRSLIDHSYELVYAKLPHKIRNGLTGE